jgi:hypothetical protein
MGLFSQASPPQGARCTLERARHPRGNPPSIKITLLGLNHFTVDQAFIHLTRIESNVIDEL